MAFTKEEFLEPGTTWDSLPKAHQDNILAFIPKLDKIRAKWGKPMLTTSGYRSWIKHVSIYKKKAEREKKVFDESKIPKASKHLSGQGIDIGDADMKTPDTQILEFQKWCKDNEAWLRDEVGVWIEDFKYTPTWVHFQSIPYGSWKPGKSIFFIP
jgi:hypothetical protein